MLPKWISTSALPKLLPNASITDMMVQLNCTKQKLLTFILNPLLDYNDLESSLLGKLQKRLVFQAL